MAHSHTGTESQESKVLTCYLFDFDGTLTNLPGEKVVFNPLFRHLLIEEDQTGYQFAIPSALNEIIASASNNPPPPTFLYSYDAAEESYKLQFIHYEQVQDKLMPFFEDYSDILKLKIEEDEEAEETVGDHLHNIYEDLDDQQTKKCLNPWEVEPIIDAINNRIQEKNEKERKDIPELPSSVVSYTAARFKPEEELVTILIKKRYKKFLPTEETINFLIEKLQSANEKVVIISKNRREYIRAVLLASDIPKELVDKITIYDINNGPKKEAVLAHEEEHGSIFHTIICDDNPSDALAMFEGVTDAQVTNVFTCKPGQFNWALVEATKNNILGNDQGNCLFREKLEDDKQLLSLAPPGATSVSIFRDSGERGLVYFDTFEIVNNDIKKTDTLTLKIANLPACEKRGLFKQAPLLRPSDEMESKQFFLTDNFRMHKLKPPTQFAHVSFEAGRNVHAEELLSTLHSAQTLIISGKNSTHPHATQQLVNHLPTTGEKWIVIMGNGHANTHSISSQTLFKPSLDINCSAKEYGDFIIQTKMNKQSPVNILLNVYGAGDSHSEKDSFAVQLASYLAENGYKTNIIASKTTVMLNSEKGACLFKTQDGADHIVVVKGCPGNPLTVTKEFNQYPNGFEISPSGMGKKEPGENNKNTLSLHD